MDTEKGRYYIRQLIQGLLRVPRDGLKDPIRDYRLDFRCDVCNDNGCKIACENCLVFYCCQEYLELDRRAHELKCQKIRENKKE
jgi:hypothetical protein